MVSPSVLKMAIDTMQKQKKTNSVPTKEETELKKTVVEGSQIHCLREIQLFGDKKNQFVLYVSLLYSRCSPILNLLKLLRYRKI